MKTNCFFLLVSLLCINCNSEKTPSILIEKTKPNPSVEAKHTHSHPPPVTKYPKGWIEIQDQKGIINDIRYATTNNFVGEQMYECGKCFLTKNAYTQLMKVHKELQLKGLGIKLYDCYRPKPVQQKLWDKTPNASYVTPPWKGSMHNRGLAIDLTIIDSRGKELAMGTEYDYFGKEAHYDHMDHPKEVLDNRKMMRTIMEHYGFAGIRTEWWHFSLPEERDVAEWEWECE